MFLIGWFTGGNVTQASPVTGASKLKVNVSPHDVTHIHDLSLDVTGHCDGPGAHGTCNGYTINVTSVISADGRNPDVQHGERLHAEWLLLHDGDLDARRMFPS